MHGQQAVGIHREAHTDACSARRHRRDAAQLETRQAAAVLHQIALALHHVDGHSGLAILVGREVLGARRGNGFIAGNDALDQPPHGFHTQRQRDHIQQQQFTSGIVARQLVGLDGGAQSHHLIRIQIGQGLLAKQLGHGLLHLGHAGRTTHHDHALHVLHRQLGITQCPAHRLQRALGQVLGRLREIRARHRLLQGRATGQLHSEFGVLDIRQALLAGLGRHPQGRPVLRRLCLHPGLCQHPLGQGSVIVIATQGRVAPGGDHLEHTLSQPQHGNVKGTAAQVVHGIGAFAGVVQAIGNRCRRGFVDQAQQVQARKLGRILGGLALRIVEVRGHGDDRAVEVIVERVFRAVTQRGQDFGTDFHGALGASAGLQADHALFGLRLEGVGQLLDLRPQVGQAATHEALHRHDGVGRVLHFVSTRLVANLALTLGGVTHHGRQQHPPLVIRQALGHAVAHRGHQGMGRTQVDPHRDAALVGIGRLTGFGDLQ